MNYHDGYAVRLSRAAWGWMEAKFNRFYSKPRSKDRRMSRREKRGARQADRREMELDSE